MKAIEDRDTQKIPLASHTFAMPLLSSSFVHITHIDFDKKPCLRNYDSKYLYSKDNIETKTGKCARKNQKECTNPESNRGLVDVSYGNDQVYH